MHYLRVPGAVGSYDAKSANRSGGISYETLCAPVVEVITVPGDSFTGAPERKVAKYIAEAYGPDMHCTSWMSSMSCRRGGTLCDMKSGECVKSPDVCTEPSATCGLEPTVLGYRYGYVSLTLLTDDPRATAQWSKTAAEDGQGSYPCTPAIELLEKFAK